MFRRSLIFLFLILLIISNPHFLKAVGSTSSHVLLKENTLPIVVKGRAHFRGHYSIPNLLAAQRIHFLVGLALRNQTEVETRVRSLYDPASPYFDSFLTPEQFTALYSPTSDQYTAVQSWLSSSGFQIDATYPNRLIIAASGTIPQVENTFNIQINEYNYTGQVFFANAIDPQVPAQFNGIIGSIIGLDNFQTFRPHMTRNASLASAPTYTPQQILAAYNIQPLINAGYKGAGQSIAIATAYNYYTSDIRTFESTYGLPQSPIINIPIGGSSVPYGMGSSETTLDIEWSSAVAQGATIRVYMAVDSYETTFTTMYNQIVVDNAASVMSTSWGLDETSMPSAILNQQHSIFQQAAAQGISIFAASGDNGAFDTAGSFDLTVDYPASDPYVTGVGGTSLHLTSSNLHSNETVWSNSYGASGGGVSSYFSKPSWQNGISALSGYSGRGVPDVAYDADPTTGQSFCYSGTWYSGGGTSIGAPEWAGITAIWNQYRGSSGRLGSANPVLYNLGARSDPQFFYDVLSGRNGYYSASAGWDLATGWGSPNAYNLVTILTLSVGLASPPSPSNGETVTSSHVTLEAQVTSDGTVQNATVTIYVDGSPVSSGSSDSNGYYSISYSPNQLGHTYSWYATASKSGYSSATSSTLTFTYASQSVTSGTTTTQITTSYVSATTMTTISITTATTFLTTTTTLLVPTTIISTVIFTNYTSTSSGNASMTSTQTVEVGSNSTSFSTISTRTTADTTTVSETSYSIPPVPKCLIATAAYGSELTPQVQALRNFRDELVLRTFAGSQFMKAFNAWYYSFSPSVAWAVSKSSLLAVMVRALIYPLIGILQVASSVYAILGFNSELGMTIAGFSASSLIGLVYDTPWIAAIFVAAKEKYHFEMKLRYLIPFAGAWIVSLVMIGIAGLLMAPLLMMLATAAFVLLTLGLSATVAATLITHLV